MSRPGKQTVDYFPHDAGASNGKTMYILQNRYGNNGYAFWFKLLEILAATEGHYYSYASPADWQFLLAKTAVPAQDATQILETLADVGAIDKELYEHKILWVQKFVDNLDTVYKRRKIDGIAVPRPEKPVLNANIKLIDDDNKPVSDSINRQSKVDESKVDEKQGYGEFKNVLLTPDEYQELQKRIGKDADALIGELSGYLKARGRKYKSHFATILNWQRRRKEEKHGTNRNPRRLPDTYTPSPERDD